MSEPFEFQGMEPSESAIELPESRSPQSFGIASRKLKRICRIFLTKHVDIERVTIHLHPNYTNAE